MFIHAKSTESASRVLTDDDKGPRSHGAGRVCASEGSISPRERPQRRPSFVEPFRSFNDGRNLWLGPIESTT